LYARGGRLSTVAREKVSTGLVFLGGKLSRESKFAVAVSGTETKNDLVENWGALPLRDNFFIFNSQ
jgi:hypothetical protein